MTFALLPTTTLPVVWKMKRLLLEPLRWMSDAKLMSQPQLYTLPVKVDPEIMPALMSMFAPSERGRTSASLQAVSMSEMVVVLIEGVNEVWSDA